LTGQYISGACLTWGIENEKAAERGQIVTISPAHSGTMVQASGEIWTAETRLQPILPTSERLLEGLLGKKSYELPEALESKSETSVCVGSP
jgi:hypothetical protein